jgi:hypothetical protein
LKGLSFKIEKLCFDINYGSIPRHWRVLGSNDNQKWTTIHDQGSDDRCIPNNHFVVDYEIHSNDFYTFFKFEQLDETYSIKYACVFYSVEFTGILGTK